MSTMSSSCNMRLGFVSRIPTLTCGICSPAGALASFLGFTRRWRFGPPSIFVPSSVSLLQAVFLVEYFISPWFGGLVVMSLFLFFTLSILSFCTASWSWIPIFPVALKNNNFLWSTTLSLWPQAGDVLKLDVRKWLKLWKSFNFTVTWFLKYI